MTVVYFRDPAEGVAAIEAALGWTYVDSVQTLNQPYAIGLTRSFA